MADYRAGQQKRRESADSSRNLGPLPKYSPVRGRFSPVARLRIEQRLNGCGRNRNERGKKGRDKGGRDGTAGAGECVCAPDGRGKRAYELIFINVSEGEREEASERERSMCLEEVQRKPTKNAP